MGFFSNLLISLIEEDNKKIDYSYPSPEMQLLMRIDDLVALIASFNEKDIEYDAGMFSLWGSSQTTDNGAFIADTELRYLLPKQIKCVSDANRALRLAVDDYTKLFNDVCLEEEPEVDADTIGGQLSLFAYSGESSLKMDAA